MKSLKTKLARIMSCEVGERSIYKSLLRDQFCKRCAYRFLGRVTGYEVPYSVVNCDYEVAAKKLKLDPTVKLACRACCGMLEDIFLRINVLDDTRMKNAYKYDSDTFLIRVNIPLAILFRQHSVAIELKENFPLYFTDEKIAEIVPLNKAWTLTLRNSLEELLGKKFDKNSYFSIEFEICFMANSIEIQELQSYRDIMKGINQPTVKLSKSHVEEFVNWMTLPVFRKKFKFPSPQRPLAGTFVLNVTYTRDPIFIAGRYNKYSRYMGQTPWVVDDVAIVKESVQDFIFGTIEKVFEADKLIFSASGREDFDVRTLGNGRPFYVRIINPKHTKISFLQFREVEQEIRRCGVVEVRDLQLIDRSLINTIKEGEEFKKKTYRALCLVFNEAHLQSYVDKINRINDHGPLTIHQGTPIRVSHRRSSDVRPRTIYDIKATLIEGATDMFQLDLVTQAGTYVKEFIHGDFGRTNPSLTEIIDGKVDIIALDVMAVDLDFPPAISFDYETFVAKFSPPASIVGSIAPDADSMLAVKQEIGDMFVPKRWEELPFEQEIKNEVPLDLSTIVIPDDDDEEQPPTEISMVIREETRKALLKITAKAPQENSAVLEDPSLSDCKKQ